MDILKQLTMTAQPSDRPSKSLHIPHLYSLWLQKCTAVEKKRGSLIRKLSQFWRNIKPWQNMMWHLHTSNKTLIINLLFRSKIYKIKNIQTTDWLLTFKVDKIRYNQITDWLWSQTYTQHQLGLFTSNSMMSLKHKYQAKNVGHFGLPEVDPRSRLYHHRDHVEFYSLAKLLQKVSKWDRKGSWLVLVWYSH